MSMEKVICRCIIAGIIFLLVGIATAYTANLILEKQSDDGTLYDVEYIDSDDDDIRTNNGTVDDVSHYTYDNGTLRYERESATALVIFTVTSAVIFITLGVLFSATAVITWVADASD